LGKKGGGQLQNELEKAIKIREARSVRCDQHGDVQVSLASGSCAAARTKRRTFFDDDGGSERARSEAGRGSQDFISHPTRPEEFWKR